MNGGPSGFYNAPITRTFVVACCLFTILFGIQGRSSKLGFSYQLKLRLLSRCLRSYTIYNRSAEHKEQVILIVLCALYYLSVFLVFRQDSDIIANVSANDWPSTKGCWVDIWKKLQLWKLIVSVFSFSSTPELLFGAYLLYYFRVFERQIGSNKYSVFISFSIIVSSLLQLFAQAFLNDPSLSVITSGPYGLIFSSFVPFFFDIPVSTRFRVASLSFSDKSFIYLAGLQLLFSSWKRSLIPGLCGILAGSLYRSNVLRIRRLKFPDFIASFFSRLSLPSVSGTSPALPARNAPSFAARQVEGNYSAPPVSFTPEPPEESIATLVSMGFDRNSARQALVHARNDVNAATNILLESQSH